jgi:Ribonuclease G/E
LAEDPVRPRLLGFTALGLAEIVRPRVHAPLHELLSGPHAAGLSALRAAVQRIEAAPGKRFVLRACPQVARALQDDSEALAELERRTGQSLILRSDPSLTDGSDWLLEDM